MQISILVATTVDGRIARSSQELADWTSKEDKRFFVAKTKEAGVMIMGRTTYETIGRPLPGRQIVVMTRDAQRFENIGQEVVFTEDSPREIIERLRMEGQEQVVIAGGASIYKAFLEEELVTDLFLTVEPILFGSGVGFLEGMEKEYKLEKVAVEVLGEKSILIQYHILYV